MTKLLILDGNNILIRALYATMHQELQTTDGRVSGVLYRCLNTTLKQIDTFRPTHFICTFDYGRSAYRVNKYPEYKANRDEEDSPEKTERKERFLHELDTWKTAMDDLFMTYVSERKVEADDIIAGAVHNYPGQKLVISSDHDLLQLVSRSCQVHKTAQARNQESVTFTEGKVREKYGVLPDELVNLWALTGDKGDNIIGLHRVGEKTAYKKLHENNFDFMQTVDALAKTPEDKARVLLNADLIQLHPEIVTSLPDFDSLEIDYSLLKRDLLALSQEWEFGSLAKRISTGKLLKV